MLGPFRVAGSGRFGFEPGNKIRPHWLGTGTFFGHGLDPVAEHGAGVGVDGAFDDALVVIDEESRRDEDVRERLLHLIELDGAADGVGRAASELALIVDRRTERAEVDL